MIDDFPYFPEKNHGVFLLRWALQAYPEEKDDDLPFGFAKSWDDVPGLVNKQFAIEAMAQSKWLIYPLIAWWIFPSFFGHVYQAG